jgi:hypothetical protein
MDDGWDEGEVWEGFKLTHHIIIFFIIIPDSHPLVDPLLTIITNLPPP